MRAIILVSLMVAAVICAPAGAQAPTLSGTVMAQGKPVSGAKVWLRYHLIAKGSATEKLIETESDSEGRFRLAGADEETTKFAEIIARGTDGRLGWISLGREVEPPLELRVELLPVGEARGRFGDAQGQPVPAIRVQVKSVHVGSGKGFSRERSLQIPESLAKVFEAVANADGTFAVRGVPLGASIYATASPPGLGELGLGWNQAPLGEFRLEKPGRLRIRFTGADAAEKLAGLPLSLFVRSGTFPADAGEFINSARDLKAKGETLEVDNVLPGNGELRFYSAPETPYFPKALPKVIVKPGELAEIVVAVEPAARVRGRVIDRQTKAGVGDVQVIVNCQDREGEHRSSTWVKTGVDGRFAAYVRPGRLAAFVQELPPGYARVVREPGADNTIDVPARLEHTFADMVLNPAVPIDGIVVDDAGKPVPRVIVRSAGGDWFLRSKEPKTDDKGRFLLKTLGADDITALRTRTPQAVTDGAVPLDMAQTKGPIKLVVSEKVACRLAGRIVDGAGKPVTAATVQLLWHCPGVGATATYTSISVLETQRTARDGRFRTEALWPGDRYHVQVTAEGYSKAQSASLKGEAGQVHDVGVITLARTAAVVRGIVVDAAGKPLAGVTVFNQGDAPRPLSMTTGADGRFELAGLYEGSCFVFARKAGHRFTMLRVEANTSEARITLRKSTDPPAAAEQPVRSKEHIAAERALAAHLLDKLLALPEPVTGGYKSSVFECLAQTDLARARKWLAEERLRNPGAGDLKSPYARALRVAEAERAAGTDAEEALAALAPLPAASAFATLIQLGERFAKSDKARALRFAEEAVVRARALELPQRARSLAKAGDLVVRLGRAEAGKKLLAEAADLADQIDVDGRQAFSRGETACYLARHDLPRARVLLDPLLETDTRNHWLYRLADHVARTDAKAALALIDDMKADRSFIQPQTRMRIACRVAERDPAEAVRIAEGVSNARNRAETFVHLAAIVAPRDRKLAWSLIDKSFALYLDEAEAFRSWSNFGGRAGMAAWTAAQAQAVSYPDMASVIARVLACRPTQLDAWSPAEALRTQVGMAKLLVLVDPAAARHLLERAAPREQVLREGGLERQDWLMASCLADPARGLVWVDDAIARLDHRKDEMAFYYSGLMQLTQVLTAPPERRLRVALGLNSGLDFPDKE